jgi:ABC-2 type transport system ATP-binding protein
LAALPTIEVSELVKDYGRTRALSGLNLKVAGGEVYGLLGPNGAGKTTTLRILSALESPTQGSVRVLGYDPVLSPTEVKARVGYVAETATLYDSLTPREYLELVASVRRIDSEVVNGRIARLVRAFGIEEFFDSPIGTLSLGTKQKVAVIASLVHEPSVLLLDEPLNGMDAKTSRIMKELITLHAENGGTVIFSSHIMEVVESICTRIGIINGGVIIVEGTMAELRERAGRNDSSLEQVFLTITKEEEAVADTVSMLREAFFHNENR